MSRNSNGSFNHQRSDISLLKGTDHKYTSLIEIIKSYDTVLSLDLLKKAENVSIRNIDKAKIEEKIKERLKAK